MDNQYNKCEKENLIRQLVEVQAQVSVIPHVRHGTPEVSCLDCCIKPNLNCCEKDYYDCGCCDWEYRRHKFNYTLTQLICLEIPIWIDADVEIKEGISGYGKPKIQ
ncbi:MAG: hypothetical protein GX339_03750 [Tissierellia bacterium]|nr:hypothetical protein [Tissierellia bacterium]